MKRPLLDLLLLVPMGVVVWLAFGWPDAGSALGLASSGDPSRAQIVAGVGLLAWCVTGVLASVFAVQLIRSGGPWARATLVMVVGAAVLTMGIVVHAHRGYQMCCGSTQSAQQALRNAP
jgi:hypothetical protein